MSWHKEGSNGFWGPCAQWNHYLKKYVVFMNQAIDEGWKMRGVCVTFNDDIGNPDGWSIPQKILDRGECMFDPKKPDSGYYVTVMGTSPGKTDKLTGKTARLFLMGRSRWEVVFLKPGEERP